ENFGDERFQEFCSVLIAKEFPDFSCIPVGQRDGGRDSLAYYMNKVKKEFIVFQVKYSRYPYREKDLHKWLLEVIKCEAHKIKKLIPKGAKRYYLITNIPGTAHLESGSIDKMNELLEHEIGIPSCCWWRDDLSRRFEKDTVFKWGFPEIINGQDVLNSLLFDYILEKKEKRKSIVRAYLADQYEVDSEVKFKQIELQNNLIDLFTDVPIRAKSEVRKKDYYEIKNSKALGFNDFFTEDVWAYKNDNDYMGAAKLLLKFGSGLKINRMVLEGAPGQGKSTISQYICQVYRAKLLMKSYDLSRLPDEFKNIGVKIPFKVDLRDVASWIEKKNPYQNGLNDEYFTSIVSNSLESFLLGHIVYHSKISDMDYGDLLDIFKNSAVLVVFDGFDEIADLNIRREVVDLINKGVSRLLENSKEMQVLITSRPAALSDSNSFSEKLYPHYELMDMNSFLIKEYVSKWVKARRMNNKEAKDLQKMVEDKLNMPHLKDLAKNAMQLAIFISLLRTRGESLPNKRTSLYDAYMELFFNRESEKSALVRDNRDLIIDIHQYLAWVLHSEAEEFKNNGRIPVTDLLNRLRNYLNAEGHDVSLANKLLDVLRERVCALVSRIQGTYEFEVQPIREYFCAKYLYETSPYSPTGSEKKGTKPDRFEAISKCYYWNNVVRFYSGCFDKGELPMLIQKLKELCLDENIKYTNYPHLLTSQILSDWVFTQYPNLLNEVMSIILNAINVGFVLNQERSVYYNDPIILPNECGGKELVKECFRLLSEFPKADYALELIDVIRNNPHGILELWLDSIHKYKGHFLDIWFVYGYLMQVVHRVDDNLLKKIVLNGAPETLKARFQILIDSNKLHLINSDYQLKRIVYNMILDLDVNVMPKKIMKRGLDFFSILFSPATYVSVFADVGQKLQFIDYVFRVNNVFCDDENVVVDKYIEVFDDIDEEISLFFKKIQCVLNMSLNVWKTEIYPWEIIVDAIKGLFGDRNIIKIISVIAAGINVKVEKNELYENLFDDTISLVRRCRYARIKSGNLKYWSTQLKNNKDSYLLLIMILTWGTARVVTNQLKEIDSIVMSLSNNEYVILLNSLGKINGVSVYTSSDQRKLVSAMKNNIVSSRFRLLVSFRFKEKERDIYVYKELLPFSPVADYINSMKLLYLIEEYIRDFSRVDLLNEIKDSYKAMKRFDYKLFLYINRYIKNKASMPFEAAKVVMSSPKEYPRLIASIAENTCRVNANISCVPVGIICILNHLT
ncbi:MAG: NACHT domain-containing protein, partial [Bacteroidetes bacterium]|nr:NACHT domain-containing protein [Bacteroidota bacterium]